MIKIAASIVLYNPELNLLKENIEAIINQVELIILIDNNSQNILQIEKQYENNKKIVFIKNLKNLGIAKALNQIVQYCIENDYEWVLTLDQDSVAPTNLISKYKEYILIENVGIICPKIIDRNELEVQKVYTGQVKSYSMVKECITSASLIKVEICKEINFFDEMMFIDLVDFEYSYRLINKGYKILRINDTFLVHQLGNLKVFKFFNKNFKVGNHSSLRKYYYFRNSIYFMKKHRKITVFFYITKKMISKLFQTIIFEEKKYDKLKSINKGIHDGIFM